MITELILGSQELHLKKSPESVPTHFMTPFLTIGPMSLLSHYGSGTPAIRINSSTHRIRLELCRAFDIDNGQRPIFHDPYFLLMCIPSHVINEPLVTREYRTLLYQSIAWRYHKYSGSSGLWSLCNDSSYLYFLWRLSRFLWYIQLNWRLRGPFLHLQYLVNMAGMEILFLRLKEKIFSLPVVPPGRIRPPCTTMPWTVWPVLLVLWGVFWMFMKPWWNFNEHETGLEDLEVEDQVQEYFTQSDLNTGIIPDSLSCVADVPQFWQNNSNNIGYNVSSESNNCNETETNAFLLELLAASESQNLVALDSSTGVILESETVPQIYPFGHSSDVEAIAGSMSIATDFGATIQTSPAALSNGETINKNSPTIGINEGTANLVEISNTRTEEPSRIGRFHCDVGGCIRDFSRKHDLNRHKQDVHGNGQLFPCPNSNCKYSCNGRNGPFRRKDKLRDHIKHVHPDTATSPLADIEPTSLANQIPLVRPPVEHSNYVQQRNSSNLQIRKRKKLESEEEAQDLNGEEVKRLRTVILEMKEDAQAREKRFERDLDDLKEQNKWLRAKLDQVMTKFDV